MFTLKNLKWIGIAIPFRVRIYQSFSRSTNNLNTRKGYWNLKIEYFKYQLHGKHDLGDKRLVVHFFHQQMPMIKDFPLKLHNYRPNADCHTILQPKLMESDQRSQPFFNVLFFLLNNDPRSTHFCCGYSILNLTLVFESACWLSHSYP